jgi:stage II sporulation protein D
VKTYSLEEGVLLYKAIGQDFLPTRRALVIGGEKVRYHLNADGRIDYLEIEPNPNGVSRDRYSPFSRWETRLTPADLSRQLRGSGIDVGPVVDVKVIKVGASRRIAALEVVGTKGTKELRGLAIRSALGLRENLFVIDRKYDRQGRVVEFTFIGRGWGHGVGLCQVGAYGLALEGFKAEDILKTYYAGVEITKIY